MRKITKVWLIIACIFVLFGSILFGGVMVMQKWDFSKLSTVKFDNAIYEINDEYKNISINTNTADIEFIISDSGKTAINCFEQEKVKHKVEVKDETLMIDVEDTRRWYDYVGINFSNPKITVSIPKGAYDSISVNTSTGKIQIPAELKQQDDTQLLVVSTLKAKTSTGKIIISNIETGTLDLSVTTGRITVSDVTCIGDINVKVSTGKLNGDKVKCGNFISNGSTGDISLKNVIATEKFNLNRSTGNITLDNCDATEIFIETDTGNIKGNLLSEKVFVTSSDTGKIDVPRSTTGGKCEISTDTGNIIFK